MSTDPLAGFYDEDDEELQRARLGYPTLSGTWGVPPGSSTQPQGGVGIGNVGTVLEQMLRAAGFGGSGVSTASPTYAPPPTFAPSRQALYGSPDVEGSALVYMGESKDLSDSFAGRPGMEGDRPQPGATSPRTLSVQAAYNLPFGWDEKRREQVIKKMRAAGMISGQSGNIFNEMTLAWKDLVNRASSTYVLSGGKTEVTPWDMLALTRKENIAAGVVSKNGTTVQTAVNRSIDDVSEGEAWATLKGAMQQMLGRDPSEQEIRDFASRANAMAAQNPNITKTTTRTDSDGNSRSSTSTSGGYNEADMAQLASDRLEDDPEYAHVQSATTYFNALLGAVSEVAGSGA